jgi:hypothetical protein
VQEQIRQHRRDSDLRKLGSHLCLS